MGDPTPTNTEALQAEYLWIQQTIEDYDQRALTIKAWSVTLSTVGIAGGFSEGTPELFLVVSGASLLFWMVEGLWKQHQQAYYGRTVEIEEASQNSEDIKPFRITSSWLEEFHEATKSRRSLRLILFWPHVMLPYGPLAIGGVVLFLTNNF